MESALTVMQGCTAVTSGGSVLPRKIMQFTYARTHTHIHTQGDSPARALSRIASAAPPQNQQQQHQQQQQQQQEQQQQPDRQDPSTPSTTLRQLLLQHQQQQEMLHLQRSRRASSRRPSLSESWIERQLDGGAGASMGGRSPRHLSISESWIEEQLGSPLLSPGEMQRCWLDGSRAAGRAAAVPC
eukprot:1137225-Pelagomonas_calceolata.AAC.6